jgi:DNA-binding GntR family transcriptional regulator
MTPGRLAKNQADHDTIISAIVAGDAEVAREALQRHTLEQGDALMRFIALNKKKPTERLPRAVNEEYSV